MRGKEDIGKGKIAKRRQKKKKREKRNPAKFIS